MITIKIQEKHSTSVKGQPFLSPTKKSGKIKSKISLPQIYIESEAKSTSCPKYGFHSGVSFAWHRKLVYQQID